MTDLWVSHAKLVVTIANRYARRNIDIVDLIGAGHLGLHRAIARFDPDRFENRLSTYAIPWIRCYIQDYIRKNLSPVQLPDTVAHRRLFWTASRLFADARRACAREHAPVTDSELCERVGRRIDLPGAEVARSMRLLGSGVVSLDVIAGEHGSSSSEPGISLRDSLLAPAASPEEDVIDRIDAEKARRRMQELLDEVLGEREKQVFLARCMTGANEVTHLQTLADRFGVTRERIYQLEASAKLKIATALAHEGFSAGGDAAQQKLPRVRAGRRPAKSATQQDNPAA